MHEQDSASIPASAPAHAAGEHHSGGRLGPFLCWAIVFADLGTSVYYTPGILFQQPGVGPHAALFVGLTLVVFILLARKYREVAVRYPEGGGVVTVTANAIHPFAGVLGGMFILVDYFLTAALSALSGVIYLSAVFPSLAPITLQLTVLAIVLLGVLNLIGVSESAKVNSTFATVAAASQLVVVLAVIVRVGPGQLIAHLPRVLNGPHLTPLLVLTGYAGAFLAFSGLESISQLSPVMAEPRERTTRLAMRLVVISIVLTSPLLTLWSTTELPITSKTDPNQIISLLAGYITGRPLEIEVALTGALLLVFASNTAIIGSYHVFLALARSGFLPHVIERRNRLRGTPHWAILVVVGVPVAVLVATGGSASLLGDLYAFGLLGAFTLTCFSLDLVRWREGYVRGRRAMPRSSAAGGDGAGAGEQSGRSSTATRVTFVLGVLTTVLVAVAWATNLVAKPLATEFGGAVTLVGLLIAGTNYYLLRRRGRTVVFPTRISTALNGALLVLLPSREPAIDDLVRAAKVTADGQPVVFLYQGTDGRPRRAPELFEVVNPYLDDQGAREAFGRAERIARKLGLDRRYVYVPGTQGVEGVTRAWQTIRPRDTLVASDDKDLLQDVAADRVRRTVGATPILHYLKHW